MGKSGLMIASLLAQALAQVNNQRDEEAAKTGGLLELVPPAEREDLGQLMDMLQDEEDRALDDYPDGFEGDE